ncbi:hypothetical protein HK097_003993, partial [Rhizophlyctis rosea]
MSSEPDGQTTLTRQSIKSPQQTPAKKVQTPNTPPHDGQIWFKCFLGSKSQILILPPPINFSTHFLPGVINQFYPHAAPSIRRDDAVPEPLKTASDTPAPGSSFLFDNNAGSETYRFQMWYLDGDGDRNRLSSQDELETAMDLFVKLRRSFVHVFCKVEEVGRKKAEVEVEGDGEEVEEEDDGEDIVVEDPSAAKVSEDRGIKSPPFSTPIRSPPNQPSNVRSPPARTPKVLSPTARTSNIQSPTARTPNILSPPARSPNIRSPPVTKDDDNQEERKKLDDRKTSKKSEPSIERRPSTNALAEESPPAQTSRKSIPSLDKDKDDSKPPPKTPQLDHFLEEKLPQPDKRSHEPNPLSPARSPPPSVESPPQQKQKDCGPSRLKSPATDLSEDKPSKIAPQSNPSKRGQREDVISPDSKNLLERNGRLKPAVNEEKREEKASLIDEVKEPTQHTQQPLRRRDRETERKEEESSDEGGTKYMKRGPGKSREEAAPEPSRNTDSRPGEPHVEKGRVKEEKLKAEKGPKRRSVSDYTHREAEPHPAPPKQSDHPKGAKANGEKKLATNQYSFMERMESPDAEATHNRD